MAIVTTQTSTLAAEVRQHYNLVLLDKAIPELLHTRWSMKNKIPKGEGSIINWRRFSLLPPATTPLTEGITPPASSMTVTNINVPVYQYGDWVMFSDIVVTTSIDPLMVQNAEIQGQQAGNTMDQIARTAFQAGTNVRYANGKTARNQIVAGDKITDLEIQKMRRDLKKANAKPIPGTGGCYGAIVDPDVYLDLMNTDAYRLTGEYQDKDRIYDGRITKLYGIMFMETTNAQVFTGAGSGGADVHSTLVFGDQATAVVDIANLGMETFYKSKESGGTSDPLEQRATQGWKATFAAAILNQSWLLRVESGATV